ncbi:C-type isolectin Sp-CL4-like [Genypterus blacodes]|uniref:C-type isolectin Sp-CL4-like n=1 Tax=Genypterus blacodes TaxID=154954 RepID=UPI003F75D1FB
MRLAVLTGILLLVVVQYAGVGNANLHRIKWMCNAQYPVTRCNEHGWFRLDSDHCMRVYNSLKTFHRATRYCGKQGGQLVSIHSLTDFNKVLCLTIRKSSFRHFYWIGAKRSDHNRSLWKWQDKETMTFSRWAKGQPNNRFGKESCLQMNYGGWGKWNDVFCWRWSRFVCSKRM